MSCLQDPHSLVWHTHSWIGHRALFGMSNFRNSPLGEFRQRKGNCSLLHVLPWPGSALLFRAVRDVTCRGVKAGRSAASSARAVLQLVGRIVAIPTTSLSVVFLIQHKHNGCVM